MARANVKPIDAAKVEPLAQQLKLAVKGGDAFKRVCDAISSDGSLSAQEVIAIAHKFVGGMKPKTKKAAVTAIGQERLRVSHAKAKGDSAAKTRLW